MYRSPRRRLLIYSRQHPSRLTPMQLSLQCLCMPCRSAVDPCVRHSLHVPHPFDPAPTHCAHCFANIQTFQHPTAADRCAACGQHCRSAALHVYTHHIHTSHVSHTKARQSTHAVGQLSGWQSIKKRATIAEHAPVAAHCCPCCMAHSASSWAPKPVAPPSLSRHTGPAMSRWLHCTCTHTRDTERTTRRHKREEQGGEEVRDY
jgi:hypothetical protein